MTLFAKHLREGVATSICYYYTLAITTVIITVGNKETVNPI